MPLEFFMNALENGMSLQPNEQYREDLQAFINEEWDNTTARYLIKEQSDIGSEIFNDIEVWINYVVGQTSSGLKNGDDFRDLAFRDIEHICTRGRYYLFDDNYWIAYFTDEFDSVSKSLAVRRCNNSLRWINPFNGNIENVPCVVDYNMESPSVQVTKNILTPNNHATVMIQGNDLTVSQLKTNMRFILGNRPFKLYGYQNALMDDLSSPMSTLLYLDLYLDEIQPKDNLATGLAFNGYYNYTIIPMQSQVSGVKNSTGILTAQVMLNDTEIVNRDLVWGTENANVIAVDEAGNYTIIGDINATTNVTVQLKGNNNSLIKIPVKVIAVEDDKLNITIKPFIEKIRDCETITFEVVAENKGNKVDIITSTVSLDELSIVLKNKYLTLKETSLNNYSMTCTAFNSSAPQILYISVTETATNKTFKTSIPIRTVSMLG